MRVGGIITLKADGNQYNAKGNFTYGLGNPKREAVMGTDGYHGYKETPQVAYIEGEITDTYGTNLSDIFGMTDSTLTLELANGKTVVLRNAYYAGDGQGNTEEGNVQFRFEGPSAEEVK